MKGSPRAAVAVLALVAGALFHAPSVIAQETENPHGSLPVGLDCIACHTTGGWDILREPLGFEHGASSGFRLDGAHATTSCAGCHLDLRFDAPRIPPLECGACHEDVHGGRTVDACAACHATDSFFEVDGELAHARTSLPLTGAHLQVPCQGCHDRDRLLFTGLDPECTSCHLDDYEGSTVVDHVASGLSTQCLDCHTELGWADSPYFDHPSVSGGYLLEGDHAFLACVSCHQVPGMTLLFPVPTAEDDCVTCHQADYDGAHAGDGYPVTCPLCHTQSDWNGATAHDERFFPIYSGPHRQAWTGCGDCHTVPMDFAFFTCLECHQHNQADMADKHSEVNNYIYESAGCLSCHPTGRH